MMNRIKLILAALLLLPLLALGANLGPADGVAVAQPGSTQLSGPAYQCCWVFWNGRWICVPC